MYYIKRKIKKCKFNDMGELYGLEIKPKGNGEFKVGKVLICGDNLRNKYSKKQLDKRFSKLYKKIYDFLISDDDSEDGIKACLGEIEKVKQAIFNKYKEHLKNKLYREYLIRIVLTENEFRNKYMEREYYANVIRNSFKMASMEFADTEKEKGKGR